MGDYPMWDERSALALERIADALENRVRPLHVIHLGDKTTPETVEELRRLYKQIQDEGR